MIQGVTYNAGTPNARVAQGEQVDFADIAQKKANIELTKDKGEKIKQPKEDKSADKKKERIFGDLSKLNATGAIVPDQHIATEWIDNVWDAAINGDLSDPNVEKDIYMQAAQIKYMLDKSKEIGEKASVIRVKDSEGNLVGGKEVVSNIYEGDLPYEEQDANGAVVEKTINSKDIKTFEDYQKYLSAQTKRLSDPVKMFDVFNYVNSKDEFIKNAFTTEFANSSGQTVKTIKTEDDKIKFGLQSLWNDKEDLRRMEDYNFKKAKKDTPDQVLPSGKKISEIKSANEYFVENYLPQLRQKDQTLEGSVKADNVKRDLGGGKGQIGKTIFRRFIDGNGNKTYTFEGVTEAENPKREFITTTGDKVSGRPYQWVSEKGKNPVLTIRADVGNGEWEEYTVSYDKATGAGLQYANPFEMDAILGDGSNNSAAKNNTNAAPKKTQSEWNAEWAKLKAGEQLVGLDGITYTKK